MKEDKPPQENSDNGTGNGNNDTLNEKVDDLETQLNFLKTYLDKATITGPTGEIKVQDKFGYFVEPVAYAAAKKAASAIREKVQREMAALEKSKDLEKNAKILIVDNLDTAINDLVYIELLLQFRFFDAELMTQVDNNNKIIQALPTQEPKKLLPPAGALLGVPYAVNAVAEIASYFRTDYSGYGREFTVSAQALITAVAGELAPVLSPRRIFIQNNYLLNIRPPMTYQIFVKINKDPKNLIEDLNKLTLIETVTFYFDLVIQAAVTVAKLKSWVEKNKEDKEQKKLLEEVNQAVTNTDVILRSASDFFKATSTIETGQTQSKMGKAILRDGIRDLGITHILAITIPSSGGDTITERGFLKSKNKYLGGLVISFALATVKGDILVADTVSYYGAMNYNLGAAEPDEFTCREMRGK